ncbi:hypothetical protein AAMO2058_000324700 [Amorphochlora amoebiformis]
MPARGRRRKGGRLKTQAKRRRVTTTNSASEPSTSSARVEVASASGIAALTAKVEGTEPRPANAEKKVQGLTDVESVSRSSSKGKERAKRAGERGGKVTGLRKEQSKGRWFTGFEEFPYLEKQHISGCFVCGRLNRCNLATFLNHLEAHRVELVSSMSAKDIHFIFTESILRQLRTRGLVEELSDYFSAGDVEGVRG